MSKRTIYIGNTSVNTGQTEVEGGYTHIEGEVFYKITNYDAMPAFFMTLVSHSDHWLFISSTGGMTAGRKNEESALFAYGTDDKVADTAGKTGSKSLFLVEKKGCAHLWEPFSERYHGVYQISRNLYKNVEGNRLIFEEINSDLMLKFQYSWQFSEAYGFVKKSTLYNLANEDVSIDVLDGIRNIQPYGAGAIMLQQRSNLVNAYKKNELDKDSGLGLFVLSSMIVDKAEPSEALMATSVWSIGVAVNNVLLSSRQVDCFREGKVLSNETNVKAAPGAYMINASIKLPKETSKSWFLVADVNQDHATVIKLREHLKSKPDELLKLLEEDIENTTRALKTLMSKADGLQVTADGLVNGRHFSNVLFNIMRGGIFEEAYQIEICDFIEYVTGCNNQVYLRNQKFLCALGMHIEHDRLLEEINSTNDIDLIRIGFEYLPLMFSRRHGDPSRPWNKFSIEIKKEDGSRNRSYQGNWRDIFQNWEALALSYPGYLQSMITRFVNASTIDGYNPYRITREGIDWEVIEPDDPWSYIGYWGDHQIIYLLKLLELLSNHNSSALDKLLSTRHFVYANVPYRVKGYADIVNNPHDTIDFDHDLENRVKAEVLKMGADGKLVQQANGQLYRANLIEKLLLTLLVKLSNFIPEGGIWLNTQRPEWNDANNALVGNGVSMVTLFYLRRYVSFCQKLLSNTGNESYHLNLPVVELFRALSGSFSKHKDLLKTGFSDSIRKQFMDELGTSGEAYRAKVYNEVSDTMSDLSKDDVLDFLQDITLYIDHSIRANKRADGLYHAYNLIEFKDDKAQLSHLYEMLEGQVAVLSSGFLNLVESLAVLDALKKSDMYREDQYSYMLYPNKELSRFFDKNALSNEFMKSSKLAEQLLKSGDSSVIVRDDFGGCHFNGKFNNAESLKNALNQLSTTKYGSLIDDEYDLFLGEFERQFDHKKFTGRSGTFFGYEGLGSIYWHMVSKLLLSVQECIYNGHDEYEGTEVMGRMVEHYYEIRAGIGINKSPELYGAFPTDPYSHTPYGKGAQQPGMTGQVKEDIINRWAELGVRVIDGCIHFNPIMLNENEWLTEARTFEYYAVNEEWEEIPVSADQLAFTYCQVPIIYTRNNEPQGSHKIELRFEDDSKFKLESTLLPKEYSRELFNRSGMIRRVEVSIGN